MIPQFNASGVLPPFVGCNAAQEATMMSPYPVDMAMLVERFGFSPARRTMLRGLLAYRAALRNIGVTKGFQWLDGSFVEDIESSKRKRPPSDIDVVTFLRRPIEHKLPADWAKFNLANSGLLRDRAAVRGQFYCDAFIVDLDLRAESLVELTRYWFGLFSHHRGTHQWKGMLSIPLAGDADQDALEWLNNMGDEHEED